MHFASWQKKRLQTFSFDSRHENESEWHIPKKISKRDTIITQSFTRLGQNKPQNIMKLLCVWEGEKNHIFKLLNDIPKKISKRDTIITQSFTRLGQNKPQNIMKLLCVWECKKNHTFELLNEVESSTFQRRFQKEIPLSHNPSQDWVKTNHKILWNFCVFEKARKTKNLNFWMKTRVSDILQRRFQKEIPFSKNASLDWLTKSQKTLWCYCVFEKVVKTFQTSQLNFWSEWHITTWWG